MLDFAICKQILNEGERKYTDEEVKKISELLFLWAQLTVQTINDLEEAEG